MEDKGFIQILSGGFFILACPLKDPLTFLSNIFSIFFIVITIVSLLHWSLKSKIDPLIFGTSAGPFLLI